MKIVSFIIVIIGFLVAITGAILLNSQEASAGPGFCTAICECEYCYAHPESCNNYCWTPWKTLTTCNAWCAM